MDKAGFIVKRKGKYMAQVMCEFEEKIEPHLPPAAKGDARDFKAFFRARITSLADDACDIVTLGDGAVNGVAQEMRDRLSPVGRP